MRIDSHHHLWNRTLVPQRWIDTSLEAIDRDFDHEDLVAAVAQRYDRTVLVQTVCNPHETPLLLNVAEGTSLIGAVVGWADLTSSNLDEALSELLAAPNGRWLRGIRHQVQHETDPEWLLRDDVQTGLATVASHDLVYELLTLPHQLPTATAAVERLPQVRFVLDHLSKPPIASRTRCELSDWARDLRRLAALPNVSAKISGLVTEADWDHWTLEDIRPWVETALDAFGPDRLLVGSDWPVCLLAASYTQVHELHEQLLEKLSNSERELTFGANAADLYRITDYG